VTAVRFLHLLAMGFFVGGQLMLAAVVVPAIRGHDAELRAAARRFGAGSAIALLVLAVTGALMASEHDRWGEGTLHAKLALIAVAIGLIGAHAMLPRRRALMAAVLVVSLVVTWLGVELAHGLRRTLNAP
jgi:uncharacterized membrane protein